MTQTPQDLPHASVMRATDTDRRMLDACFLGPYGENDTLVEKLVVEFLRDHVHWRRNFHPEDPPAIPTSAAQHPQYQAFEARMRRELHQLSAALKQSVPFHSPRYIGYMASDLLLPGLAAQILALPYNPNNVSEDAAPITVQLEVQVGLQLARMLGYPADPSRPDCAFGHLTSGGTLANYQALRLALENSAGRASPPVRFLRARQDGWRRNRGACRLATRGVRSPSICRRTMPPARPGIDHPATVQRG